MSTHDPSTPATERIERFARNFRNMNVVKDYDIIYNRGEVKLLTTDRGVNFQAVRAKGWEFDVTNSWYSQEQNGIVLWCDVVGCGE